MSDITSFGLATAFAAGIVSFLSPCVLPMVPAYVSYIAGHTLEHTRHGEQIARKLSAFVLSLCFVLGFSTIFITLGASATVLGRLLQSYRYETNIVGGAIVIVFGLFTTGFVKIPWFQHDLRFHPHIGSGQPLSAYVLGLAFGFGWTPCIGPVLGAILTFSAVSSNSGSGIALLSAYALGLGLPFLASAFFTNGLAHRLKTLRRTGRALQIGAGVIMIVMGIAIMTGQLSAFSYWLIEAFPALAKIG